MHLSKNITWLRQRKALFPADLADQFNLPEITCREWESGETEPTLSELIHLSNFFGVSTDHLLLQDLEMLSVKFKAKEIKMLGLDVDGVLTDGGMYYAESGDEIKRFHTRDGRALLNLGRSGMEISILSGGVRAGAIEARASRLGINRVYVGTDPKDQIMEAWLAELNLSWEQVAYIGDDVNDLGIIAKAGLTACPADAVAAVKQNVDIVLTTAGGQGVVREFVESFLMKIR